MELEWLRDIVMIRQQSEQLARVRMMQTTMETAVRRDEIERRRKASLPKCPSCGHSMEGAYSKCSACSSDVCWVDGFPCKPNDLPKLQQMVALLRSESARISNRLTEIAGSTPTKCPSKKCPSRRPGTTAEFIWPDDEPQIVRLTEKWAESFKRSGVCPVCEKRRNKTFWRLAIIGCIAMPVIAAAWVAAIVYAIR